ncbi:NEDD8 protease Nep1 [Schizosaccharomyces japonicus yFS275]|uniref:NEDD8 protease Nep1 n=1 Tax=Schizosaccharomyces japonicus (strain yFS275 / FY16936) TaxID=402676 RepID=T0S165_SCHJY|nr:NEDD8 protease Nep1 [Schizosaccharomyces japonicus yFS275]EQC53052.1 NEDD8 protease Nep1 [Schizosaccharomyces japonicus yFS275]
MSISSTVLEFYDVCFKKDDFDGLHKPNWITDTDIDLFYELIERFWFPQHPSQAKEIVLLRPSIVLLLAQSQLSLHDLREVLPPETFTTKYLFLPVNDISKGVEGGGTHWSLLVVDVPDEQCYYYDSLSNGKTRDCTNALCRLSLLLNKHFSIHPMKVLQQRNGYDCGVHVCSNSIELVRRLLFSPMPTASLWDLEDFTVDVRKVRAQVITCVEYLIERYGRRIMKDAPDATDIEFAFFRLEKDQLHYSEEDEFSDIDETPLLTAPIKQMEDRPASALSVVSSTGSFRSAMEFANIDDVRTWKALTPL